MPKVVSLVTLKRRASSGVIETLRNMTKAAKAEGFSGIAIAAIDQSGCTHTAFASGENIATLIGAVERVKYRLLTHQDGDSPPSPLPALSHRSPEMPKLKGTCVRANLIPSPLKTER